MLLPNINNPKVTTPSNQSQQGADQFHWKTSTHQSCRALVVDKPRNLVSQWDFMLVTEAVPPTGSHPLAAARWSVLEPLDSLTRSTAIQETPPRWAKVVKVERENTIRFTSLWETPYSKTRKGETPSDPSLGRAVRVTRATAILHKENPTITGWTWFWILKRILVGS